MNLTKITQLAVTELSKIDCKFALCGGLAADLYRKESRVTRDIDFLFFASGKEISDGTRLLEKIGLNVNQVKLHHLTKAPAMNKKSQVTYILVGRNKKFDDLGVDLLLPEFPWFYNALDRAQFNLIDFGFAKIPTITPEDVILAKLFSKRLKDLDDIISIFSVNNNIDMSYLESEMIRLKLSFSPEFLKQLPFKFIKIFKRVSRINKKILKN
jgi:hypothetical protein